MVLTEEGTAFTLNQLRELGELSGKALIEGVKRALSTLPSGYRDDLDRLWIILVQGKTEQETTKQETSEIYRRFTRLIENWSKGPFNLDLDLWMNSYFGMLKLNFRLLQHLLRIQTEFSKPDVVREEVSHITQLLSNSSPAFQASFEKGIINKIIQEIVPSAVEKSERHEDIQKWREFDEIIRLEEQYLAKEFLPSI